MRTVMPRLPWTPIALATALGVVLAVAGPEPRRVLVGGAVALLPLSLFVSPCLLRPGPDGAEPSPGEGDAWSAACLCLGALLVPGMIAAGGFAQVAAAYLALFAYGIVALCMPALRKRRLAQQRWRRGAIEDERDAAIQLRAARWSKHALEALLILAAALYARFVGEDGWRGGAMPRVATPFGAMFAASAIGGLVAAFAYRRDRR